MIGRLAIRTALGPCTLEWTERGLSRLCLEDSTPNGDVPTWVSDLAARVEKHFAGDVQDFSDVPLDCDGIPKFAARVYEALRKIGPGRTTTYGELARRAGSPKGARAVGAAMRTNPFLLVVPCHRVLGAGGAIGGFSAPGGSNTKERMLAIERASLERAHNLPFDANAAAHTLARRDRKLGALIESAGPVRITLDPMLSVFDTLARAIVYQQLAGAAARTIHARLRALLEGARDPAEKLLVLSDAELRGAGISANKARALRDLATRTMRGELPTIDDLLAMDDEAIIDALTTVRGIGRWTVEMLLIFRLGRPDVLPLDDHGIRKAFQKVYRKRELPSREVLARAGQAWRPYRSIASWYLWRALE
jgi:methylated-DNA-[protein]-cysteine S-methyltransferase